jgi:hypothetical protein
VTSRAGAALSLVVLLVLASCAGAESTPSTAVRTTSTSRAATGQTTTTGPLTTTTVDPFHLAPPEGYRVEEFRGLGLKLALDSAWVRHDTSGGYFASLERLTGESELFSALTGQEEGAFAFLDMLLLATSTRDTGNSDTVFFYVAASPYDPGLNRSQVLAGLAVKEKLNDTISVDHLWFDGSPGGVGLDVFYLDHAGTTITIAFVYPYASVDAGDAVELVSQSVRIQPPTARYVCAHRDDAFELYRQSIQVEIDLANLDWDGWEAGQIDANSVGATLLNGKSVVMNYVYAAQQMEGLTGDALAVSESLQTIGSGVAEALALGSSSVRLGDGEGMRSSRDDVASYSEQLAALDMSSLDDDC